ncbi:MAG TPA: hypothetical protein ENN30_01580 [Candidatus Woesearchaeota archaeon]|nr:hypothetical protein [Candidatus Woesearchaeota archaeon]
MAKRKKTAKMDKEILQWTYVTLTGFVVLIFLIMLNFQTPVCYTAPMVFFIAGLHLMGTGLCILGIWKIIKKLK